MKESRESLKSQKKEVMALQTQYSQKFGPLAKT